MLLLCALRNGVIADFTELMLKLLSGACTKAEPVSPDCDWHSQRCHWGRTACTMDAASQAGARGLLDRRTSGGGNWLGLPVSEPIGMIIDIGGGTTSCSAESQGTVLSESVRIAGMI